MPQGTQTVINVSVSSGSTVPALLQLPDDYGSTSINYPLIVFLHGRGESGSNLANIYNSAGAGGPAYFIGQGTWPSSFTNPRDGQSYKFIVVSPQAPGSNNAIGDTQLNFIFNNLVANYRVNINRIYLMGISGGGQAVVHWVGRYAGSRNRNIAAAIPASAEIGQPSQAMIDAYVADGIRIWGIGDAQGGDGLGTQTRVFSTGNFGGNGGSVTVPAGYGNRFTSYSGGHCCWGPRMNPTYTESIVPYYGGGAVNMNMYEWMLQFEQSGTTTTTTTTTSTSTTTTTTASPSTTTTTTSSGSTTTTTTVAPTTRTINVNIYGSASYVNSAWNNWQVTGSPTNATSGNFTFSTGGSSGITAVLSQQNSYSDNGPSYPVTVMPQVVGRDASWSQSSRTLTFNGLDNSKTYDFSFLGTRSNNNQFTRYTIGATTIQIATDVNYTNLATFTNIVPSAGQVVLTMVASVAGAYNYINGFTITEKTSGGGGNTAPTANAGADQAITLPTSSVSLSGSGSDSDGTIASYAWTQVSGTSATITSPSSQNTTITGLSTAGIRVFRLTVTDNGGATGTDDVQITVNSGNTAPIANAGSNQTITLPTSTATLTGSGSDSDGTITGYAWTQISGTTVTITTPSSQNTTVTGLSATGLYTFRLTVTDNGGLTGTSDVTIQVNPQAIAGDDYITQVGVGEYYTCYVTNKGFVYGTHWGGYLGLNRDVTARHLLNQNVSTPLTDVVDCDGNQYTCMVRTGAGNVYTIRKDNANGGREGTTAWATDYLGNSFTGTSKVYGAFTSFMAIKNGIPYIFGASNFLGLTGWNGNPQPLPVPAGRTVTQLQVMEMNNNPSQNQGVVMALLDNGTVILYTKNGNGAYTTVSGLTGVKHIGAITQFCYIAATDTNIFAWGQFTDMVGLPLGTQTPTSILATFTAAGLRMPLKQIQPNWTCAYFLDSKNDGYGIGDNVHGNLGTGVQLADWKNHTYNGVPGSAAYAWDFRRGEVPQTSAVQIPGKWRKLFSSGNLANQAYGLDMGNNLYSWGRNKANALGNALAVSNADTYPEWGNVPFPKIVTPLNITWPTGGGPAFSIPSTNLAPQAFAGVNQYINKTSTTLVGLGHQQGGSISTYAWTKISGPTGGTIASPSAATTNITALRPGTYVFRLTVTGTYGTANHDVSIYVRGMSLNLRKL